MESKREAGTSQGGLTGCSAQVEMTQSSEKLLGCHVGSTHMCSFVSAWIVWGTPGSPPTHALRGLCESLDVHFCCSLLLISAKITGI